MSQTLNLTHYYTRNQVGAQVAAPFAGPAAPTIALVGESSTSLTFTVTPPSTPLWVVSSSCRAKAASRAGAKGTILVSTEPVRRSPFRRSWIGSFPAADR